MAYRELKEALLVFLKVVPFVQKLQNHIYRLTNFYSSAKKLIIIYGKFIKNTRC